MTLKDTSKKFVSEAIPFLIWGALLMAFFERYPELIQKEIKEIFFESAAFRTIMLLFVASMFSAGLFLFALGPHKKHKKMHQFFYEYLVLPPAKFGISFSAVAFGLILGLALVSFGWGYREEGWQMLGNCLYLIFGAGFYWFFTWIIREDNLKPESNRMARLGGLVFVFGAPLVGWLSYPTT